jgi:hypothetical protein
VRWEGPDGYWASDDGALVDVGKVHRWMSEQSYWASGRPREVMARSIENSLVLGLYSAGGEQVGFARFVTDYATFGWLCDVFVESSLRGGELGTFLVDRSVNHPAMRDVRQVLMAEPGRSIYRRQGFAELLKPERWMERPGQVL